MASRHVNDPSKGELSKAVLTLTKHKQRLEEEHLRLLQQMARTQEELDSAHRENALLRTKLSSAQNSVAELQKKTPPSLPHNTLGEDRKGGGTLPHLGQQMLKGLSSLVTASENSLPGPPSFVPSSAVLGPEDVGKLVEENENLHRKLFDLRTKYEKTLAEWKREISEKEKSRMDSERKLCELREQLKELKSLYHHVDHESIVDRSMLRVLEHFFKFSVSEIVFPQKDRENFPCLPGRIALVEDIKMLEKDALTTVSYLPTVAFSSPCFSGGGHEIEIATLIESIEKDNKVEPKGNPLPGGLTYDPSPLFSFSPLVHLSLQGPSPSEGLDAGISDETANFATNASCALYRDTFLRISGALTIWIATLKKLLPFGAQGSSCSGCVSASVILSPFSQGDAEDFRDHSFRSPLSACSPIAHEAVMSQGHVKRVLDRLNDLYVQHITYTKQITAFWEDVLEMTNGSGSSLQKNSSLPRDPDKSRTPVTSESEKQRAGIVPPLHLRGSQAKEKEALRNVLASPDALLMAFTHTMAVGEGNDSYTDGEEGGTRGDRPFDESKPVRMPSPPIPQQVFLCLLLLKLVKSLIKWLTLLSQHLPLLQRASASLSTVAKISPRGSFTASQSETLTRRGTADTLPHRWRSEKAKNSTSTCSTFSPSIDSSVLFRKPQNVVSTTDCNDNNDPSILFLSAEQKSTQRRPYNSLQLSNDHYLPFQSPNNHEKAFIPPNLTSSLNFPADSDFVSPTTFESCGKVVLLTIRGVLKRMQALLTVLWKDYLKDKTLTSRDGKESRSAAGNERSEAQLVARSPSVSLLSRIISLSSLMGILFLIWKAINTFPELSSSLHGLSVIFRQLSLKCDSAHLRNVYHLLNREFQEFSHYTDASKAGVRKGPADTTSRNEHNHLVYPSLRHFSSALSGSPSKGRAGNFIINTSRCENNGGWFRMNSSWGMESGLSEPVLGEVASGADTSQELVLYFLTLLDEADAVAMNQQHNLGAALWELAEVRDALVKKETQLEYLQSCLSEKEAQFSTDRGTLQEEIWRLSNHLATTVSCQNNLS